MPYIDPESRFELTPGGPENDHRQPENPGELNFRLTDIVDDYMADGGELSYHVVNEVVGVLECMKLELYRRVAAPYEDKKCKQNGDVYTTASVSTVVTEDEFWARLNRMIAKAVTDATQVTCRWCQGAIHTFAVRGEPVWRHGNGYLSCGEPGDKHTAEPFIPTAAVATTVYPAAGPVREHTQRVWRGAPTWTPMRTS